MTRPVAVVTGASSGIGEALARQMAEAGDDLVLVARSAAELGRVADAIRARTGRAVLTVTLDLGEAGAADRLAERLRAEGLDVRRLVNNAGYGLAGDVVALPREGQLGIVDVNCRALLDLTLRFLPEIIARRGAILNVASVASFTAGPGLAVYYASKAYVLSFSRALRHELKDSGVAVTALCPGPTPTRFGERAGFDPAGAMPVKPLSAEAVAAAGLAGLARNRAVVVPGLANKLLVAMLALVPQPLVMPVIDRAQRARRRALS